MCLKELTAVGLNMPLDRILLIYPPTRGINGISDSLWMLEPLGLEYVAAACQGIPVIIQDMRLEPDIYRTIQSFRPDMIAFTALTCHVNTVKDLAVKIKIRWPHIKIIVGGQHATLSPAELEIPQVDFIVRGDGYSVMKDLLSPVKFDHETAGLSKNEDGVFNHTVVRGYDNFDNQPFPRRELVKRYSRNYRYGWHFDVSSIRTAVGCPFKCSFCSVDSLTAGKYLKRSVENVISELKTISSQIVYFTDDESMVDYNRMMILADMIQKEGMKKKYLMWARVDTVAKHRDLFERWKKTGLDTLMLGYESPSAGLLEKYNKNIAVETQIQATKYLDELKIDFEPLFIIDPDFDGKDFNTLKAYVKKQRFFWPGYSILTPFPGSPLYAEYKDKILVSNWDLFDGAHAVIKTRLPEEEFYRYYREILWGIPLFNRIRALIRYPLLRIPAILKAFIKSRFNNAYGGKNLS
mgnify:CR=1 FL=1